MEVYVDNGSENFNGKVDDLVKDSPLARVLAQVDVTFSNSRIRCRGVVAEPEASVVPAVLPAPASACG